MKNKMKIAIYLRLSKEDELAAQESNSISYQRLLLKGYIERNFENYTLSDEVRPPGAGVTVCPNGYEIIEFVDDGYSGTSMDRPGMNEMLAYVRQKKINCIIVKDFSRFSRDYVEIGSYVEQIFPFMEVRFISVNDHYDSKDSHQKTMGMNLAFKTLVNDLYSKDLSVKVKSSLTSKKERGIYCSGNCPFGYRKKADDRNQVEIVEEEAEVVREIFRLTLAGYTSVEIAKKFNQERVKTPVEYLIARGAAHRKPAGKEFSWQHPTICAILRND
ncbi:MAG: recombinase family protein, partial [Lachnospiraceae bacterium]|nr:recombinase family protein [Lachnospiraceae bacterium]